MRFDILAYGADPTGATPSTAAINRAFADCAAAGGGYVDVPAGEYVSGTIRLLDHVYLYLCPGSTILGSEKLSDYSGTTRGCPWYSALSDIVGNNGINDCKALIVADRKTDCGLLGHGTVDGRRSSRHGYTAEKGRPFLVVFSECQNSRMCDVTLKNPGFFTFYGLNCTDLLIHGVTIRTADSANGDGLDFDGGKRITISDCNIDAGDDAIGLKTLVPWEPCEDFTITGCMLRSKHWGAVRIGPESAGDMRRINIQGCCMYDSGDGFKLQLTQDAVFEDFNFSNITMTDVLRPLFFTSNRYNMSMHEKHTRPKAGKFRRIKLSTVTATMRPSSHFGDLTIHAGNFISALPGDAIEDVTLENVHIIAPGGGSEADAARTTDHGDMYDFWQMYPEHLTNLGDYPSSVLYLRNAKGIRMRDCIFETKDGDPRAALATECVDGLLLSGCEARGCGGLLRHYRCYRVRIDNCDGDIHPFTAEQSDAWESFRTLSLATDQTLEALAQTVDIARAMPTVAQHSTCTFSLQGSNRQTYLLLPKVRGCFAVTVDDRELCRFELPNIYRTPVPFACALGDALQKGEHTVSILPIEDFELLSDILIKQA